MRDVGDRAITTDNHCQTVGSGSIPNLAKLSIRILHHIDPAVDVSALEVLVAQAEAAGSERARVRNATTPSFTVFHDAAAKHGPALLEADVTLHEATVLMYLLLQIVVAPTRERMLLYARACDTWDFDPRFAHSAAILDAMKADHPTHASTVALATVLFADGQPTELVLGVYGCTDARKNNFFHRLDLTTPILPETAHMLPLVHSGLRQLYEDYTDGNFLLRSALKPLGDTPFGSSISASAAVCEETELTSPHDGTPDDTESRRVGVRVGDTASDGDAAVIDDTPGNPTDDSPTGTTACC